MHKYALNLAKVLNTAHKKQLSFCRYLYETGDEHDKCSGPFSACMHPLTFLVFDLLVWPTKTDKFRPYFLLSILIKTFVISLMRILRL